MRAGSLRTLLRELRAGGVSEYSSTKRGETISLKLAGPFTTPQPTVRKAAASAALPFPPISSAMRQQFADMGVDPDHAAEVIRHSGIGGVDG